MLHSKLVLARLHRLKQMLFKRWALPRPGDSMLLPISHSLSEIRQVGKVVTLVAAEEERGALQVVGEEAEVRVVEVEVSAVEVEAHPLTDLTALWKEVVAGAPTAHLVVVMMIGDVTTRACDVDHHII